MTTATKEKMGKVVSRAEWLAERQELLQKEKEFTRLRDELSAQRREMPWVKVDKAYTFEGPKGKVSLGDLFAGREQLVIYHFMFGPGWEQGCPSCSFISDSFDGITIHLANRDTTLAVVSRATWPEIDAFKKRMEWKFPWVSSNGTDFNYDFHVSFTPEEKEASEISYNFGKQKYFSDEGPGLSAFIREDGQIYHTYSSYARGLDILLPTYNVLDMTAKGRDEDGLPWPMAWVRHHDRYEDEKMIGIETIIKALA